MAHLILSTFSKYSLTSEEELSGRMLSSAQLMVLQNKAADIAQAKINLKATPESYAAFIQEEGFLSGQLATIQWLLDDSEAANQEALSAASAVISQS